jgi:hypothetical protein
MFDRITTGALVCALIMIIAMIAMTNGLIPN